MREVTPEAMALLVGYHWPGNVRELRNIVERMLVLYRQEPVLRPEFLPEEFHGPAASTSAGRLPSGRLPPGRTLSQAVEDFERGLVLGALREAGGVQTRAARLLGTTRRILGYRLTRLGIRPEEFRKPRRPHASGDRQNGQQS